MSEHSITVKRDGKDVIYAVDAKTAADAKKIAEQAETRTKDRSAA
jgi:hypothetical protein